MTINTIKITQLVPIGTGLDANSTLPIVDLNGNAVTRKTTAANLANLILSNAGGVFPPAAESLTSQTVTNAAQPNITSIGTLSFLSVTGNISVGGYVVASQFIGNLTGNVSNANFANFASEVTSSSQPNITSLGNLTGLNITGNITALYANIAYFATANYFIGDGRYLSNIVSNTANTVTNNAQPNITSLGTLISLNVSGNVSTGNISGGNLISANYFVGDGGLLSNIGTANTGIIKTPFSFADSSPMNIVNVSANSIIAEVSIVITTPFNGTTPTLSVGDGSDANRLLATTDCLANEVGTFTVAPAYKYVSPTQLILTINSGSSSSGEGLLIINYD